MLSRRNQLLIALSILALVVLGVWLAWWSQTRKPVPDRLVLIPARFDDVPGWREDAVEEALSAFLRSCPRFGKGREGSSASLVTPAEWREGWAKAAEVRAGGRAGARAFFEAAL